MKSKNKGTALVLPLSIPIWYRRELAKLIRQMEIETRRALLEVLRAPDAEEYFTQDASLAEKIKVKLDAIAKRYGNIFAQSAESIVKELLTKVDTASRFALNYSLKDLQKFFTVRLDDIPPKLRQMIAALLEENKSSILNIPALFFTRILGDTMRAISNSVESVTEVVKDITAKRAEEARKSTYLLSESGSRNLFNRMSIERLTYYGITQAEWVYTFRSHSERPRHLAFNGKPFDLAKGAPVGDNGGNLTWPGFEPNCKCMFKPILEVIK